MIPKDEALRILHQAIPAPGHPERVDLTEALGRVLAEDAVADVDAPPFDRSAMDGYALRADDVAALPVELEVIGLVKAGDTFAGEVRPGTAVKIMTGAPVPAGYDSVQPIELCLPLGADRLRLEQAPARGANVARRGEDMREGEVVLPAGSALRALEIGMLSTLGQARPLVYPRPRVTVFATGDELIGPDEGRPGPGQIRESNGAMLTAQVLSLGLGISARFGGIVRDEVEATREAIETGLAGDVLILSGGVSMGDYDFVHHELKARGLEVLIEKVAIKPGKPLLFGRITKVDGSLLWVFGLPGNPVSSFSTFEIFVRPFLRGLMGCSGPHLLELPARLVEPMAGKAIKRTQHLPARLIFGAVGLEVRPVRWNGSGDLRGMMDANAFIIVPAGEAPPAQGATCRVIALEPDAFRLPRSNARAGS
ncbi:MAG: molybdopterin molybdotransferase MoeA [Planctomycetes bacterium]|nr:molybdopterin molybdotransferase MoeA [Planctomycetota bacterium]